MAVGAIANVAADESAITGFLPFSAHHTQAKRNQHMNTAAQGRLDARADRK
jgi:hypothetical protein